MDNRRKIILAIVVGLVIILILLFYWFLFRSRQPVLPPINGNANVDINANIEPVPPVPPPTPERQKEEEQYPLGLKQVATTFAERYLSYSSDQPNKNLEDLKPLMTLKMQATARELVDQGQTSSTPVFIGYSAKALSSELMENDNSKATVKVKLQRMLYSGDNPGPKVFYQEMVLQFVKIGNDWRVDSIK